MQFWRLKTYPFSELKTYPFSGLKAYHFRNLKLIHFGNWKFLRFQDLKPLFKTLDLHKNSFVILHILLKKKLILQQIL